MTEKWSREQMASLIDHTNLKPDAGREDIRLLCEQAVEYGFYSVCVNSAWVPFCRDALANTNVKVAAVCGFPLGACASEVKAYEAAYSVENGASEIDMVMSVGHLKSGEDRMVVEDISRVVRLAGQSAQIKVILETCFLNRDEIQRACRLAEEAGAHFVKTSTGFGTRGASLEDVRLMKASVSERVKVKASGGIRSWRTAVEMIDAGADRLGTSSGPAILAGKDGDDAY